MSKIGIIGMGGSIAVVAPESLDLYEYGDVGRMVDIHELIARIPQVAGLRGLVPLQFKTVPSESIHPQIWLDLNRFIHEVVGTHDLKGVVITHGTSTIEETAYFLNLVLKVDVPVVLVGAQRPITGISSDGPLNLFNAIKVAGSAYPRGLGVLLVHDNRIFAARDVAKLSSYGVDPFGSPDLGALGYVDSDGEIAIHRMPLRRRAPDTEFDVRTATSLPRVDIIYAYAGVDDTPLNALVDGGSEGIVIAGLSPGTVSSILEPAIERAVVKGVGVAMSMQAGSGRVLARRFLKERKIVAADDLNPKKTRILLMLSLMHSREPKRIQEWFKEY